MKQLLTKEFKLTGCPLTYFFLTFTLMTMIPGYPILVGAFFICLGIFYTFQFAREFNDTLYTALLPVRKRDVVKARFLFVTVIELAGFLFCTGFTLVRMSLLSTAKPYVENPLMNANLVYLGGYLTIMVLFNLIFITGFYKTAYYFGKPFIIFSIASLLLVGVMETLHHLPGLEWLNDCGYNSVGKQLIVLAGGAVIYLSGTVAAVRTSMKRFESIDL